MVKTAEKCGKNLSNQSVTSFPRRKWHPYCLKRFCTAPLWSILSSHVTADNGWSIGRKQLPYPEYMIAESLIGKQSIWVSSPALLTHLNLDEPQLHQCRILGILSSGGMLPEETATAMRAKLKTKTIEGYGSTETGVIAFREQAGLWTPHL